MKKIASTALLLLLPSAISAQSIIVNRQDGGNDEIPAVGSLKFDGKGNVTVTSAGQVDRTYPVNSIARMDFVVTDGVREILPAAERVEYCASEGYVRIAGSAGSHLTVCGLDGVAVMDMTLCDSDMTVSLSSLSKGVYLLKLDGSTMKIVI